MYSRPTYFKSRYSVHTEKELVLEILEGAFQLSTYKSFKLIQASDPKYNRHFNILVDIRNVVFEMKESDVRDYISFLHRSGKVVGKRKNAILTSTPNQVVVSSLFKMNQEILPQQLEIFSTTEAAIAWLGKSQYIQQISRLLDPKSQSNLAGQVI